MTTKKTKPVNPLFDSLAMTQSERDQSRNPPWHVRLKEKKPDAYQSIVEIVEDYHAGGEAFRKLGSIAALHRWLIKQDVFPEPIGYNVFRKWALGLRR